MQHRVARTVKEVVESLIGKIGNLRNDYLIGSENSNTYYENVLRCKYIPNLIFLVIAFTVRA